MGTQRTRGGFDARAVLRQALDFFRDRIWAVRVRDLPGGRAAFYKVSRVAYSTVLGFRENRLTFQAAALTYFSVLSVVPFLAFAFAVLKGFGAYGKFIELTVRPYLKATFGPNPALLGALEKVLDFVEHTDVGSLGTLGMLLFVWTSISLLSSVESTLNRLWGAKTRRPLLRQVTDYMTLMVTTPILLLAALAFGTAARSSGFVLFLSGKLGLGPVITFLFGLSSVVITCIGMIALFLILPNVRTRFVSAILGGVVAGVLWQLALLMHVRFQVGVANYNALYAGFGALPIFLVWTYVSWVAVLLGAQLAASHQNEQATRQAWRARHADQTYKETLALIVMAQVARDYVDGCPRRTPEALAEHLEVPTPVLDEILEALVRARVLARAVQCGEVGYLPARDVDELRVEDILDALRRSPDAQDLKGMIERQLGERLQTFMRQREEEARASTNNVTVRALATLVRQSPPQVAVDPAPGSKEVLDAKQPDVPT